MEVDTHPRQKEREKTDKQSKVPSDDPNFPRAASIKLIIFRIGRVDATRRSSQKEIQHSVQSDVIGAGFQNSTALSALCKMDSDAICALFIVDLFGFSALLASSV